MTVIDDAPPPSLSTPDRHPNEPIGVVARYQPALGAVDPDPAKGWIARMRPLVFAHRGQVFGSLLAAFAALLAQVAVPAVTGLTIDRVLVNRTDSLEPFVAILIALGIIRGVLGYAYRYGMFHTAYQLEYDLRTIMYEHLTRLSFGYYDRVQSGQIISRANSDIRSVQMFLAFAPVMGLTIFTFGLAFVYMLTIHVPLTVVAVAALPLVYLVGSRMRNLMFPLSWIVQGRLADMATVVDENINGVRVVKSFAAEEAQVNVLARAAQRLRWSNLETIRLRADHNPLLENLPRLGLALVLLYGGWLAIEEQVSVGTLVAFSAYVVLLQAPFRMLGMLLMMSQRAKASAGRIFEVLDEQPDLVDRPDASDLLDPTGAVGFRDVSFSYGQPPPESDSDDRPIVLDGFSLDIAAGETVALVGRTGSGKSTVARLLARFYDVSSGSITIDGVDIRDTAIASLRHSVAAVADDPFLFSVSLRDNIRYARPDASDADVEGAARAAQAHGFITELPGGYDEVVGERGYTLSGGQRQRIAIARTLLANPAVLVLDDATSAIDVGVEQEIHAALHELTAQRTTLIIAHRLSTIALADRVALIEGGRVVAEGTHSHLLATEPRYVDVLASTETETDPPAGGNHPNETDPPTRGGPPAGGK
ncbi:MAG: ABC transporter ATP-binding protein [Actinomycetia bacterium]|nr:ABC transporter ATP-binding protein [Actinomycetes bacterium]